MWLSASTWTCQVSGSPATEALANLREALELYFEDAPSSDASPIEAAEVRTLTLRGA